MNIKGGNYQYIFDASLITPTYYHSTAMKHNIHQYLTYTIIITKCRLLKYEIFKKGKTQVQTMATSHIKQMNWSKYRNIPIQIYHLYSDINTITYQLSVATLRSLKHTSTLKILTTKSKCHNIFAKQNFKLLPLIILTLFLYRILSENVLWIEAKMFSFVCISRYGRLTFMSNKLSFRINSKPFAKLVLN